MKYYVYIVYMVGGFYFNYMYCYFCILIYIFFLDKSIEIKSSYLRLFLVII